MGDKTPLVEHELVAKTIFQSNQAVNNPSAIQEAEDEVDMANYRSTSSGADWGLKTIPYGDSSNQASTSRAFPQNQITLSSYETNQFGSNQPSTFDEEHLKKDTVSIHVANNQVDATEDLPALPNAKTFQLCFVSPDSISGCIAYLKYEVYYSLHYFFIVERHDFPASRSCVCACVPTHGHFRLHRSKQQT